jgi:ketosteroid isomerase-like protein
MTRDVEAALRARGEALPAQDWDAVERLLDDDFVYTNSRGERLMKAAYLEFLRDGPLRWVHQSVEDMLVSEIGDTAVVTGVVVDHVVVDGTEHELHFSTTQTYVRVDGAWLYLAGQTAPIDLG